MNSEDSKVKRTATETVPGVFPRGQFSQVLSENHKLLKQRFNVQIQHHPAGLWQLHVAVLG